MLMRVYPLQWPFGRDRTVNRQPARFREGTSGAGRLSFDTAVARLDAQLQLLGALYPSVSTDVRHNRDGSRDRTGKGSETPADPGAGVRFRLDGRDYELACDRWDTPAGNVAALAAHIDALRGQERWGVADLKQAFAGHVALPAPEPWWEVLGVTHATAQSVNARELIGRAFREKSKTAHPDAGGDRSAWDRLNAAYEAARQEIG